MDADTKQIFFALFKEATIKCFGHPLQQVLTETESKQLYNKIFDATGLVIGWKSLKNYSLFILNDNGKEENPSAATLDTLARYVLDAPYTTELERKTKESHLPYWFKYKEAHLLNNKIVEEKAKPKKSFVAFAVIILVVIIAGSFYFFYPSESKSYSTDFHSLNEDSLVHDGWFVKDKDETFWHKRADKPKGLSLFTLAGDNWMDSIHRPQIKIY